MGLLDRAMTLTVGVVAGLLLAACALASLRSADTQPAPEPAPQVWPSVDQNDAHKVWVFHDDQRGVTCWHGWGGLACLSDNDLWRPR